MTRGVRRRWQWGSNPKDRPAIVGGIELIQRVEENKDGPSRSCLAELRVELVDEFVQVGGQRCWHLEVLSQFAAEA